MSRTEIEDLLRELETVAEHAGPGKSRELALLCTAAVLHLLAVCEDKERHLNGYRRAADEDRAALAAAEQRVCDFQAASLIDVGNQGGPCRVEPRHVEAEVTRLRSDLARLADAYVHENTHPECLPSMRFRAVLALGMDKWCATREEARAAVLRAARVESGVFGEGADSCDFQPLWPDWRPVTEPPHPDSTFWEVLVTTSEGRVIHAHYFPPKLARGGVEWFAAPREGERIVAWSPMPPAWGGATEGAIP